jgi:hypothetical protein
MRKDNGAGPWFDSDRKKEGKNMKSHHVRWRTKSDINLCTTKKKISNAGW